MKLPSLIEAVFAPGRRSAMSYLLIVIALLLIIVLLVTTTSLYLYLQTQNRAPRTAAERDVAIWETAVAESRTDANAWASLAYAYSAAGRHDDALKAVADGEYESEEPLLVLVRADVLRVAGRFREALESYDLAEDIALDQMEESAAQRSEAGVYADLRDDSLVRVYFGRGICFHELGELDAAITDLEEAARLAPSQVNIAVTLGDYYAEAGEKADARDAYNRALQYVPDYAPALEGLERVDGGG